MDYQKFCRILNKHIFEGEKKELLRRIAGRPDRFIGLFRPTKPGAKVLQYLLQSHEIRFGNAVEELVEEILKDMRYKTLPKSMVNERGKTLLLDQYFTDGKEYYFIEQKVRDDHDSTKKRGQISNFEAKLEVLYKKHGSQLIGVMYFIDPDLSKNKNYYLQELNRLKEFYGLNLYLFYGKELFVYLKHPEIWDNIILWLEQWKDSLPELPEINFDNVSQKSFEEIKDLELRYWRKILENENLWRQGIIKVIFRKGDTLKLALKFFDTQYDTPYRKLADLLNQRLKDYFE